MIRQGDVLLIPTPAIPATAVQEKRAGRIVLADGEQTGHAHAVLDREAVTYHDPETEMRFLAVLADAGVDLVHEEHDTLTIPAGNYIVRRQREYSPEEIRQVAD